MNRKAKISQVTLLIFSTFSLVTIVVFSGLTVKAQGIPTINPTDAAQTYQAYAQATINALTSPQPSGVSLPTTTPVPTLDLDTIVTLTLGALTQPASPVSSSVPVTRPDGSLICTSVKYASATEGHKEVIINVPDGYVGYAGAVFIDGEGPTMMTIIGPYSGIHTMLDGMYCGDFPLGLSANDAARVFRQKICYNCAREVVIGPDDQSIRTATPSNLPTPTLDPRAALSDENGYIRCPYFVPTGTGRTLEIEVNVPAGQLGVLQGIIIDSVRMPLAITIIGPYKSTHMVTDGAFCGYFPKSRQAEVEQVILSYPNCVGCTLYSYGPNQPPPVE